ncbi:uncharacterized protein [Haliotis cracherodii]|uniref:uncharacterized protein n=1 Tax=Haliotis cracherodii TaxID=6455 RepID=UPI0039EB6507
MESTGVYRYMADFPSIDSFGTGLDHLVHDRTTYTSMNEWRDMVHEGGVAHPVVPQTLTDARWSHLKDMDSERRKNMEQKAQLEFRRAYSDLTSKIAYIHPNPGLPRTRQGRIGGTWRHIKEVLGHSGNRTVFVNGLVGVYDSEFNNSLQAEIPHRPHLANPCYAPLSRDLDSYHQRDLSTMQRSGYVPSFGQNLPSVPRVGMVSSSDPDVLRKMSLQSQHKYKGVYKYK